MKRVAKSVVLASSSAALLLAGAGMASASAGAEGAAVNSPGVLSGNVVQIPVHIPINLCGNTVNVVGLLNPAFGNTCVNA
ncbi:chaplin [Streptomyces sp. NPDC057137]|uniref:chaplin n=1 Tax=Streptomyces sp. NPDC057137 TaxID=3346030 RepID=UPI003641D345